MQEFFEAKRKIKSENMEQLAAYRDHLREHPRLVYLFVELTDQCNLHCWHCGSECGGGKASFLDTELLLRTLETVAEDFKPQQIMICLTGGEPLLHPDFFRIVEYILKLGFLWGITTNGTLIDEKTAYRLKALSLASVTISMDGTEQTHDSLRGRKGAFQKTVAAVRHLNAAGIPVQITSVIHRDNFAQLDEMYELMVQMKTASWRLINLEPIGRALQYPEKFLTQSQMTGLLDYIRQKRFAKDTPMDVRFGCSHYLSFEYEREVRDNYFFCGSGLYVASILCNGDIYSCLDIERRPELVQGNIEKDRFSEVWYQRFQEFRKDRSMENETCRSCPERRYCGGDSTHTWEFDKKEPAFCIRKWQDPADK
ncbi:MAG: radical SAM protein [Eubacteriales bacterium]|nr:radical SAM protein [Eubacteriales bacterium]